MGVPFSRTKEGLMDFRRFGGTLHHRTAFCGRIDRPAASLRSRRAGTQVGGRAERSTNTKAGRCSRSCSTTIRSAAGLIAMNLQTLELKAFAADAVIMATGGPGLIFGKSTNSMTCTGSAVSACYQQGARYANGEFIQVHPTSIPGEDKLRLMSESARGEGGRVWVPKADGDARQPAKHSRERTLVFPRRKISGVRQSRSARHRDARDLPGLPRGPRRRRRESGLSRPDAHPGRNADTKARGDPRDLRDVRRRRSAIRADADLSRRSLFDGRAVGRLRTADKYSRPFRGGRVRLFDPRSEPSRSKFARFCVYGGFVAAPSAIEYAKNVERGSTETNGIHDAELKRSRR